MKTAAVFATLIASAAAFAPSSNGRLPTRLFEDAVADAEPAEEAPAEPAAPAYVASQALPFLEYPPNLKGYTGDHGFDPFRFSDFVPMDFLREAELKHGRISMLAIVGFAAVDLGLRVYPVPEGWEDVTAVQAHDVAIQTGAMSQLFLWFTIAEAVSTLALVQMLEGSGRRPGDFGLDPLNYVGPDVPDEKKEKVYTQEITHCRLAMFAVSGMITQAVLTQGPFPYV